jgi:hypothetical protein
MLLIVIVLSSFQFVIYTYGLAKNELVGTMKIIPSKKGKDG